MQIPKPSEDDKEFFRSLVPAEPDVEIKPMFGNLGALSCTATCSPGCCGFRGWADRLDDGGEPRGSAAGCGGGAPGRRGARSALPRASTGDGGPPPDLRLGPWWRAASDVQNHAAPRPRRVRRTAKAVARRGGSARGDRGAVRSAPRNRRLGGRRPGCSGRIAWPPGGVHADLGSRAERTCSRATCSSRCVISVAGVIV